MTELLLHLVGETIKDLLPLVKEIITNILPLVGDTITGETIAETTRGASDAGAERNRKNYKVTKENIK